TRRSTRKVPRRSYTTSPAEDSEANDALTKSSPEKSNIDQDDDIEDYEIMFEDDDEIEEYGDIDEEDAYIPGVSDANADSGEAVDSKKDSTNNNKNRKLTAEYLGIAEEDIAEIEEVYDIAADPVSGNFYTDNIEDAIAALGLTAGESEIKEIIATADPKDSGIVDHYLFVEIMALKYQERRKESAATSRHNAETGTKVSGNYRNREEMEHAFGLFIEGRQTNQFIAMQDLRNAAILAKDNVTDEDLQEMLRVASGNEYGTVSFENFAVVMQQSGAIS
ncbi:uncharacterized protein V2V93DRAFT_319313, partial [Kockiozyma suomiensis]|uniref:uncharacterized protein n=1 Tax=Kockiozyma suomiensis TaxID=1337062 RepID=UPI00334407E4